MAALRGKTTTITVAKLQVGDVLPGGRAARIEPFFGGPYGETRLVHLYLENGTIFNLWVGETVQILARD